MFGRIFSVFFLKRFFFALLTIFAIYNPSDYSYYSWITGTEFAGFNTVAGFGKILVGFGLASAIIYFAYATLLAPDKLVYWLILLGVCGMIWMMQLQGWVSLTNPTAGSVIAEILIAFALALGSLWGFVWRAGTGIQGVANTDAGFDDGHHGHH